MAWVSCPNDQPSFNKKMKIEERIDDMAGEVLETLSVVLPEVNDDGLLGRLVLEKALKTYNLVLKLRR